MLFWLFSWPNIFDTGHGVITTPFRLHLYKHSARTSKNVENRTPSTVINRLLNSAFPSSNIHYPGKMALVPLKVASSETRRIDEQSWPCKTFVNEALHEKIGLRRATVAYRVWQEVIRRNCKEVNGSLSSVSLNLTERRNDWFTSPKADHVSADLTNI